MPIRYHYFCDEKIPVPALDSMGYSANFEFTRFGPAKRNCYLIHYVLSGKGYFNGNPVSSGQGFLITKGQAEHYYADKSDPWAYLWVISSDEQMQKFFTLHNADPNSGIFDFHNLQFLESIAKSFSMMPNGIYFDRRFSPLQLSEYFLGIYNNCVYLPENNKQSNAKQYFDFATNYVNAFLHLPITVDSLCEKLGVSQPYLYRIFKQESGVSPKEYLQRQKLITAKKLLAETDFLISEIAASVGFTDALAFSKFFSKAEKISPSAYRNSNRE